MDECSRVQSAVEEFEKRAFFLGHYFSTNLAAQTIFSFLVVLRLIVCLLLVEGTSYSCGTGRRNLLLPTNCYCSNSAPADPEYSISVGGLAEKVSVVVETRNHVGVLPSRRRQVLQFGGREPRCHGRVQDQSHQDELHAA